MANLALGEYKIIPKDRCHFRYIWFIDDHSLSLFFTEIHAMWRKKAEIFIIECDDSVGQTYAYLGRFPKGVSGRGGTQFDPAFEFLHKEKKRQNFDGCIYLTDGYANNPKLNPHVNCFGSLRLMELMKI